MALYSLFISFTKRGHKVLDIRVFPIAVRGGGRQKIDGWESTGENFSKWEENSKFLAVRGEGTPCPLSPLVGKTLYIYNIYTIYICIYVYMYICMYIYMYIYKVVTTISINLSIYLSSLRYIVCDHEITQAMQFAETSF